MGAKAMVGKTEFAGIGDWLNGARLVQAPLSPSEVHPPFAPFLFSFGLWCRQLTFRRSLLIQLLVMASQSAQGTAEAAASSVQHAASNVSASTQSLWERISLWASENKGVVYTIAGVTLVVTAGGVIYYTSSGSPKADASTAEKKSKKERRKAKEAAKKASDGATASRSTGSAGNPSAVIDSMGKSC